MHVSVTSKQVRSTCLLAALPFLLGLDSFHSSDLQARATIEYQYARLCVAVREGNPYLLNPALSPTFRATDVTGKIEHRQEYVDTLTSIGASDITDCTFKVESYQYRGNKLEANAVWALRAKASSAPGASKLTSVSRVQDLWISAPDGWRLLRRLTLTSREWEDGWPELRSTFAARLSPTQKAAIVADMWRQAHPLLSAYPLSTDRDLEPIARSVKQARIVAMGEGSHGTSEFFALKDRVFRYLVEHDGFDVFAQETNWYAGQDIDVYLQTGRGNVEDLLAKTFPTWNNQEILDLLRWMRSYNIVHPGALHFVGIDMQYPQQAARLLIALYTRYDPVDAARVTADEACVNKPATLLYLNTKPLATSCVASTQDALAVTARNSLLQRATTRQQYLSAYHAADVARQAALEYAHVNPLNRSFVRDRALADNVKWLLSKEYPGSKVFLLAHNAHVGIDTMIWPSMGTYLRQALGASYFAIGQTFYRGRIKEGAGPIVTFPPPSSYNSSESIFHAAGVAPFFVDFRTLPRRSTLAQWLETPREVRSMAGNTNGARDPGEIQVPLRVAFDGLTFIEESHPPEFLQAITKGPVAFPAGTTGWMASQTWNIQSFVADRAMGGAAPSADGEPTLYLSARPGEADLFARIGTSIDGTPYRGRTVHLTGLLATSKVEEGASVVVRVFGGDAYTPLEAFTAPRKQLFGSNTWTAVDTTVAVPTGAKTIDIDFYLSGGGTARLKNLSLPDFHDKR